MPFSSQAVDLTRDSTMWIGSSDDLRRLLRLVESHVESLKPAHIQNETRFTRDQLKTAREELSRLRESAYEHDDLPGALKLAATKNVDRASSLVDRLKSKLAEQEAQAAKDLEIHMRVVIKKGDRRRFTGQADDLIDVLEGTDFSSVRWNAPGGYQFAAQSISLEADREYGVKLEVRSDNPQWGLAADSDIRSELARRTPKLRFLRHAAVLQTLVTLPPLLLALSWASSAPPEDKVAVSILGAIFATCIGVLGAVGIRKYIPAFELVASGTPSRSRRTLKVALSGIVTVALGVLGTWVSQFVLG